MKFLFENLDIVASTIVLGMIMLRYLNPRKNQTVFFATAIIYVISTWFVTYRAELYLQTQEMEKLLGYAPSYAWVLEKLGHDKMTVETKSDDPLYLQLVEYENGWLKANPFVSDIYTLKRTPTGDYAFIVDSETDYNKDGQISGDREQRTPIGESLERNLPEIEKAFSGSSTFTNDPYSDRWGTWVSAFVPLYANGKVDGVLGLDFPAQIYVNESKKARSLILLCSFLLFTTILGLYYDKKNKEEHNKTLNSALQKAEQAAKVKAQFLANMSHEIRTPLNGILGMTSLMADNDFTTDIEQRVGIIKKCAESLMSLINDILDFSKIESGKLQLEAIDFNIKTAIEESADLLKMSAENKGVTISIVMDHLNVTWVRGDLNRFRQVLWNLLGNAIKFTPSGPVTIVASSNKLSDSTVEFKVSVIDSGIGISPEAQEKLFQSFTQVDASTTRKFGGTGLGLSICKGIVEAAGGTIQVESNMSEGSKFTFTMLGQSVGETPLSDFQENTPELVSFTKRPYIVLVADDHSTNRLLAVQFLEKLGYRADSVCNGLEVLDAINIKAYDVIFLDCQMPELDGYSAAQKIHQRYSKNNRPWIVALSAGVFQEDKERCFAAGMDDFVPKPFDVKMISEALERCQKTPSAAPRKELRNVSDPVRMNKHFRGDRDIMLTVVADYLATSSTIIKSIENGIHQKDAKKVYLGTHKLRGAITNFFAVDVQRELLIIESQCKSGNLAGVELAFPKIAEKLKRLTDELQDLSLKKGA